MNVEQKLKWLERLLFTLLVAGLAGAGFLHELYRGEIDRWVLLPLIAVYMTACYAAYRALHRCVTLAVIRRLRRSLPPGWEFDRDEANDRD